MKSILRERDSMEGEELRAGLQTLVSEFDGYSCSWEIRS